MKFGENLKRLRKAKKLSQEELAEKVNVSRQSVSKWETGDAYPEMNNILELCHIFHCNINELVNDSIIDMDSLDEETKMSIVKFKREKQKKMKGLSSAIAIISKISRIAVLVAIPAIVATMIILGVLTSKMEFRDDILSFRGLDEEIRLVIDDDNSKIMVNGKTVLDNIKDPNNTIKIFRDIINNNSKYVLIGYMELGFIFLLISLVFIYKMLKHLEQLFNNIKKGDTPFTLENVSHIKKMSYLMILVTLLPSFGGAIFEILLGLDLNVGFEMFTLLEVLFLFSIAYIFEYGYEIQLDSNGKMYGDENE